MPNVNLDFENYTDTGGVTVSSGVTASKCGIRENLKNYISSVGQVNIISRLSPFANEIILEIPIFSFIKDSSFDFKLYFNNLQSEVTSLGKGIETNYSYKLSQNNNNYILKTPDGKEILLTYDSALSNNGSGNNYYKNREFNYQLIVNNQTGKLLYDKYGNCFEWNNSSLYPIKMINNETSVTQTTNKSTYDYLIETSFDKVGIESTSSTLKTFKLIRNNNICYTVNLYLSNNVIQKLECINSLNELIYKYTFEITNNYLKVKDEITYYSEKYIYSQNGIYMRTTSILTNSYDKNNSTLYELPININYGAYKGYYPIEITMFNGRKSWSYLDDEGRVVLERNEEGQIISYEYNSCSSPLKISNPLLYVNNENQLLTTDSSYLYTERTYNGAFSDLFTSTKNFSSSNGYYEAKSNISLMAGEYISFAFFAYAPYKAVLKVEATLVGKESQTVTKYISCDEYARYFVFDTKLDFQINTFKIKVTWDQNSQFIDDPITWFISPVYAYNINSINNYIYDSNNNLLYIENKSTKSFKYNNENRIVSSPTNKFIERDPNTNRVNWSLDNNDNKTTYTYSGNNPNPTCIVTEYKNSKYIEKTNYNDVYLPTSITDKNNQNTRVTYDSNYKTKEIENNDNSVLSYEYEKELVSKLTYSDYIDSYVINYDYDRNVLKQVDTNTNGYVFQYTDGLDINKVSMGKVTNAPVVINLEYKELNDKKTPVLEKNTINNITHTYTYDDKLEKLQSISEGDDVIVSYDYDALGNTKKIANENSINEYTYDINNLLTKEVVKDNNQAVQTNNYIYENDQATEIVNINNKNLIKQSEHRNIRDLYNNNDFYHKIKTSDYYSCFFNEYVPYINSSNLTNFNKEPIINITPVVSDFFDNNMNSVTFTEDHPGYGRIIYKDNDQDISKVGLFFAFTFKVSDLEVNDGKTLFSYGYLNDSRIQVKIVGDSLKLELYIDNELTGTTSISGIEENKFHMFGLNVYLYTNSNSEIKMKFDLYLDNEYHSLMTNDYTSEFYFLNDIGISIGQAIYSSMLSNESSKFYGTIANIIYGPKANIDFIDYYRKNSLNLINQQCIMKDEESSVITRTIEYQDVLKYGTFYPLNGDFLSFDNQKPTSCILNKLEDKSLAFIYDNELKRYVYNLKQITVGYGLNALQGTVIVNFKPTVNQEYDKNIFNFSEYHYLKVLNSNELYLYIDGYGISTNLYVNHNQWNTIALSYELTPHEVYDYAYNASVKVWCNGSSFETSNIESTCQFPSVNLGTSSYDEENAYGQMESLLISSNFMTNTEITSYVNSLNKIIKENKYSDDGRLSSEEIFENNQSVMKKTYTYHQFELDDTTYDTYLVKDIINTLGPKYSYTYHHNGSIETVKENDEISKIYYYDYQNRLTYAEDIKAARKYTYTYDELGNVLSMNQTFAGITERTQTFEISPNNYNCISKMVLDGVEYNFTYTNGFLTNVSYVDNGNQRNIKYTYTHNRLSSLSNSTGDNIYKYDGLGRLIEKVEDETLITKYYYSGNNLVTQIKYGNRVDYLYDDSNMVYGFKYQNMTYYYDRDLTGTINGIYNNQGEKVVEYTYDPYGRVIRIIGTQASTIGNINEILYKGYLYDKYKEVYYCNSRVYSPIFLRWLSMDDIEYLDITNINGLNLYCYCNNNPVNYKQRPVSSGGSITIPSISSGGLAGNRISGNAVKQIAKTLSSKSSGFNLFGYELRTSAGWDTSPDIATSFFGRIGFSSYVTHTQGQSGMLYAFAGSTSDIMNWMGTTYYAGVGINLFDILGVEAYVETIGIGAQVSIGRFSIGADINLIGGTSITFGWNTDLGNGMTKTDGFTLGVNTGCLVAVICWIYKFVTTGDPSPVPGLQPAY